MDQPDKLTILTSVDGDTRDLSLADWRFAQHRPSETVLNAELKRHFPSLAYEDASELYERLRNAYRESEYDEALAFAKELEATFGIYPPAAWIEILAAEGKRTEGIESLWNQLLTLVTEWTKGRPPKNAAQLEHSPSQDQLRWMLSSIRFNQAELAREEGRLTEAAEQYAEARELGKDLFDDAREAKLRINEAYVLAKLGRPSEAKAALAPVLIMDSTLIAGILERKSVELVDLPSTLDSLRK